MTTSAFVLLILILLIITVSCPWVVVRPHVLIMISATDGPRPWTTLVQQNHESFCCKNGFDYIMHVHHHPSMVGIQPQWSKVLWLLEGMDSSSTCRYLMWIDDDILITNFNDFVTPLLHQLKKSKKDVLLVRDAGQPHQANTGIMILTNSTFSREFLKTLWRMRQEPVGNTTLGTCRNQTCLHEQEALNLLLQRHSHIYDDRVMVILPREGSQNLNTFHRESHFDRKRLTQLVYDADTPSFRWKPGDNTCHCCGMEEGLRMEKIKECQLGIRY